MSTLEPCEKNRPFTKHAGRLGYVTMLKIIDRHLLRQFLVPTALCLGAFTMIFVVFDLLDHINRLLDAKTPPLLVAKYYACAVGPAMQYLAPASLMLATLYTLYTLTRNNELVAMRASGISLYRIMLPFVAVGVIASVMLLVLSETVVPAATEWADEFSGNRFKPVTQRLYANGYYFNTAARRQWQIARFDVKHPEQLEGVEVAQETAEGKHARRVTADRGLWLDGQWWFVNPMQQTYGTNDNPIGKPVPLGFGTPRIAEMQDLDEHPRVFANATRDWEHLPAHDMLTYLNAHPNLSPASQARKRYDFYARLASPWACLIVTLFAIPTGARTGRQGVLTAVFAAIGLLVSFYAVSQLGLILGASQLIYPWLGAWFSNIIFSLIGLGMLARMR
jgi:lipopolysaccharide export system permease protein